MKTQQNRDPPFLSIILEAICTGWVWDGDYKGEWLAKPTLSLALQWRHAEK